MGTPSDIVLAVKNLETWYGPVNAIKGVNLDVQAGHIVAVLGANGAGKTTLLNTIAGVIDPFKGSVEFKGQPIHGQDPDRVARGGVVLVPEGRQVFPFLSVRENLTMGTFARASRDDIEADMQRVFGWFPRLLERQHQHGGLLSGGEQQMLAIGRALIAQPQLMLLDEPSLGLSPKLVEEIFGIIVRINAERATSMLLVEQNATVALAVAHSGYIMENGKIVIDGSADRLASDADVREFYLGMGGGGETRSFREIKHYKRRKRWLS